MCRQCGNLENESSVVSFDKEERRFVYKGHRAKVSGTLSEGILRREPFPFPIEPDETLSTRQNGLSHVAMSLVRIPVASSLFCRFESACIHFFSVRHVASRPCPFLAVNSGDRRFSQKTSYRHLSNDVSQVACSVYTDV